MQCWHVTKLAPSNTIQLTHSSCNPFLLCRPQYTRGGDLGRNADLPPSRPGVVIGGGGAGSIGPPPGARGRGGRGVGMRHSRSDTGLAAAVAASIDSSQAEAAQRAAAAAAAAAGEERLASVTFSAEDFPSVSGGGRGGVTAPLGTWVGGEGRRLVDALDCLQ